MSDELEQFWISIYDLCLAAELARLSIEVHTESGLRTAGIPTIVGKLDPDCLEQDSRAPPPVIEIGGQTIVVDQVVTCAIFAPGAG